MDVEVGQEWSFKTDRFTENSVIIHHIQPFGEDLTSVHVTIKGAVRVSEDNSMNFGHFPFEIEAFKSSLKELLGHSNDGHDTFNEGYKYWKNNNGGVFTVSIDDAIQMIVETNLDPDRVIEE